MRIRLNTWFFFLYFINAIFTFFIIYSIIIKNKQNIKNYKIDRNELYYGNKKTNHLLYVVSYS